jgi:glycosyltransferase involved in cell wall biosynthesis
MSLSVGKSWGNVGELERMAMSTETALPVSSDPGNSLVSVVIPTHNRAHLIIDALSSAVAQSWRPIEIIVVDDGSTDGTPDEVKRWHAATAPEISVQVIAQRSAGGNAARNNGSSAARGDFIAFLDSDDVWHPSKLRKQMAVLRARPQFVAVYCGIREVRAETGDVLVDSRRSYPQGELLEKLLVADVTAPTSTCLVYRAAFERAGMFDTELSARQDWDLWIRLSLQGGIGAVEEALVDMRHHDGPRTISNPLRELAAHRTILDKYTHLRQERGFKVKLASMASLHRRAGRVHLHHRNARLTAMGHYLLAVALWPIELDSYAALIGWFLPARTRRTLHIAWNRAFGRTLLAIKSH